MKKITGKMIIGCIVCSAGALSLLAAYVIGFVVLPPDDFAVGEFIEIPKGATLGQASNILEEKNIIRSSFWFEVALRVLGEEQNIKSGMYHFSEPQTKLDVIRKTLAGNFQVPTTRVTIFEGEAGYRYAPRIAEALPFVEQDALRTRITQEGHEGYLYPDTYLFPQDSDEQDIIRIMRANFDKKIDPYQDEIATSGYTEAQVITMASLVETEAGSASYETKRSVAGVLWKRFSIDMPIQADAVFSFIFQEHLPRVLFSHLEVDSPYNLYTEVGLPPGPIGSPSIDSIRATLDPVITDDLFYLTGFDGVFYYAKTLAAHERNRRLHLNYNN